MATLNPFATTEIIEEVIEITPEKIVEIEVATRDFRDSFY